MKNIILFTFYLVLFFAPILRGQNLVVNPSFEMAADSNDLIPPGEFAVTKAKGWSLPSRAQASLYSSIPMMATLNRAMNRWKFTAKEGNNVVGITTYGTLAGNEKNELREYIQGTLTQPLAIGKKYIVSYYVHFHVEGTNNIGVSFAKAPISTDSIFRLPLKPLVNHMSVIPYSSTNIWHLVRDSFVAREPYKHFIIGNFSTNRETKVESNKYRYHKAYLDEIRIEEATDDKMPPRTFDLVAENEVPTPVVVKEKPKESTILPDTKVLDSKVDTKIADTKKPEKPTNPIALKGDVLVLDKVFFPYNASTLEGASSAQLDKLVAYLHYNTTMKILVKGHTSSEGSEAYNQKLSENRAQAVVNYLIEHGIKGERLAFKGFGKTLPIYPNDTEENRHKNRRVEFEIMSE
jgi:outer membrane protein OmpA-like peptidoglycan-associated protein